MSCHYVTQNKCIYALETCGSQFGCPSVAYNYILPSMAQRSWFGYICSKESKHTQKSSIPHKYGIPPIITAWNVKTGGSPVTAGHQCLAEARQAGGNSHQDIPNKGHSCPSSPKRTTVSELTIIKHLIHRQHQAWMGAPQKQALWKALGLTPTPPSTLLSCLAGICEVFSEQRSPNRLQPGSARLRIRRELHG